MESRIEIGDPLQYAGIASEILQTAWKPPCLHYSPEYLAWQFGFPSEVPTLGVIAFVENRPAGCAAVTARRFSCGRETFPALVFSFVAVAPSAAGRGIARTMYASLLDALPRDVPVFAFAGPDSLGERLLLNNFSRAGFRHRTLRTCRAVGYVHRAGLTAIEGATAQETTTYEEFASMGRASNNEDVIWTDVTPREWHHYGQDPRGRVMVTVRDADGRPLGTAMLVTAEIVSSEGVQKVPMLESVTLAEPTSHAVAALLRFAAARFQPGSVIVASNMSYIDPGIIKTAGARALPSSFNAYAFVRGASTIVETAAALNLEVI